ncbi:dienelactone hydrolase [Scheffersomyces xylosifermentans]|uniref:dienelactone hydrolase n=1 Tax=Scheffersomyces xylosifermentans TaxID=1304137 RepID=UPI00315D53D9
MSLSPCCFKTFYHEGEAKGKFSTVGGLDSYVIGEEFGNEKIIVILTDIFGYKYNNIHLVADQLSQLGKYQIIIPDILKGDPVVSLENFDRATWFGNHGVDITGPIVDSFLSKLKEEKTPKKLFAIGYCFGSKFALDQLTEDGHLTAAAVAHPSLFTEDAVEKVTKPLLISVGVTDASFGEELREKTVRILSTKKDLLWQLDLFSNAPHGYACRGNLADPQIKHAKEKTIIDQISFFSQF